MSEAAAEAARPPSRQLAPFTSPAPLAPRSAARSRAAAPFREVFGFVNAGNIASSQVGYPSWNLSLLSTIAFFGLHVGTDGNLVTGDTGWAEWNSGDLTNLVSSAHGHGVRVVVTIILQDTGAGMCSGLGNGQRTIDQIGAEVRAKGVDGINIDYEGANASCWPSSTRSFFTSFVQHMRAALPGYYLSVDTYASSAADGAGFFDVGGLAPSTDSFFVMAYDLDGNYSWGNWQYSPLNCASYCFSPTAPQGTYHYNDTSVAAQYLGVVPGSKVILGVPYYGYTACVAPLGAGRPGPNAVANPSSSAHWLVPRYLDSVTTAGTPGISDYATARDPLDPGGQEPFSTWTSSTYGCWRESYWDDTASLGHKYDVVNGDNLRGVGIFTLDYGGGATELWNELALKFSEPSNFESLGGTLTSAPAVASWAGGRLDIFGRGSDNALWHRWWDGSRWSDWEWQGGILASEPAAVAWGPNRLDVFVRGIDDQLWHKWWDGSRWSGWEPLGGVLSSGPAVASWGSGRLDVFLRSGDSGLWHKWWDGSRWSEWEGQGGLLTSSPGAVSWAGNRLDVFVRSGDNGYWHRWWDGSQWSEWEPQGGTLTSGPAVATGAVNRLELFGRGTDGALWRKRWDGSSWGAWEPVGGLWATGPGAVWQHGSGSDDVAEVSPDGGLWHAVLT